MGKPYALLLTPEAPYPMLGGGSTRTAFLFEYLARRYAVDVIVFREPRSADPAAAFPPGLARDIRMIELPRHSRRPLARAGRNLIRLLRGRPPLNDRFAGFATPIAGFLRGRSYELAVIEHFWCAPYADEVAPHAGTLVLDLHNIESVLYSRSAAAQAWPAALALRRFAGASRRLERRWLPRYSLLLATSDADARLALEIAPSCRCEVVPNTIPWAPQPARPEEHLLAFSGNFEYHANISAVGFFCRRIWPALRERFPGLRWRLVGRNPEGVRRLVRNDARIELTGPVEDAVHELAAAQVVVVPLLAGSGTRFKILEAWAAGRAVVSTGVGAEGLPGVHGEHLLLADTPQGFVEAVSRILAAPEERRRLGQSGRALYEQRLTWNAAWASLERAGI